MFTGLIQALGKLQKIEHDRLKILCLGQCESVMADIALGDSIAVDGVCLTVASILPQGFTAVASPETLERSTLGDIGTRPVNLESSLRVGAKIGGHFVTGHVDGPGYLQESHKADSAWELRFATTAAQVRRYIVPKGSISVNGISLTVADCSPDGSWFTVAVIPTTYYETNLQYLRPDDRVNLEGDILGKYVERLISPGHSAQEDISLSFLSEHGYG